MIPKTKAIVIKRRDFRETSLIVTFFSQDFGKIKCLFKGIRANPKKFASALNLFSYNEIIFYKSRHSELHLASQCDLVKDFERIRADLRHSSLLTYIMELVDAIMPLEDKNVEVFKLLLNCLESADSGAFDAEKLVYLFQIKLLILSGFRPHLDSCIACDKKILEKAAFSVRLGGLICSNCNNRDRYSHGILKGTIASIMHVEHSEWQKALNLGLSGRVKQELRNILFNFLSTHLDRPLKSSRFLCDHALK
jgi:DNA repair protein RecO (recombination protein O)